MRSSQIITGILVLATFPLASPSYAADPSTDNVFVDKVSQGGMYEVEASKLAERRAQAPA